MSKYLILIYEDEAAYTDPDPGAMREVHEAHQLFGEKNAAAITGGEALEPTSTATAIRRDPSGELVVTDGPFAETKEALGGFYLIEAEDLDEALAIAKQVPARFGGVEVRPVMVFG